MRDLRVVVNPNVGDKASLTPLFFELVKGVSETANGYRLHTTSDFKDELAERLGLSKARVEQAISEFYKSGLILRKSRGVYIFNPKYFRIETE